MQIKRGLSSMASKPSLLIPGRGEPIKDATVVIHEDKIDWVGPQSQLPVKYSAIPFARVSYLMPGLWDCHVHYFGVGESDEGGGYAVLASSAARAGARNPKIWKGPSLLDSRRCGRLVDMVERFLQQFKMARSSDQTFTLPSRLSV
jgi:hypothetical protein